MINIGIYIYENAEVLDFSGPFEVFSTANRISKAGNLFHVFLVAEKNSPVMARAGYSINPNYDFKNHPVIDVLIIPGGVHSQELQNPRTLNWICSVANTAQITASVCTGAFLLAETGLLEGLKVTTHWEDIADLQIAYPTLTVLDSQRWVDEGRFVTSSGISGGIDMSLYLVSRLVDFDLAERTARQMEYQWQSH